MKGPSCLVLAGLALALASGARAQLTSISGTVHGDFDPLMSGDRGYDYTTVTNTATESWFNTGDPADGGGQTRLRLTDSTFTDVGSGGTLAEDFLWLHNGNEYLGTTADHATFDLKIDLPDLGIVDHTLTTVTVGINNTQNMGADGTPDGYFVTFAPQPASLDVDNTRLTFHLSFPGFDVDPGTAIVEHGDGLTGLLTVTFTPIPEPATYGFFGLGVIALATLWRRRHRLPPVGMA
jgi:MYXO-CTERM domain-containing protein